MLGFEPNWKVEMPLDRAIAFAKQRLLSAHEEKKHAFFLVQTALNQVLRGELAETR